MKRSLLFTLCLLILFAAPIHAQEPTPAAPWPPDPALIFADGVTWEEVQPARPAAQPAPRVINDFERDVIRVRDESTDTWREFAYPLGIVDVDGATLRSDGMVWLLLDWEASNDPRPDDVLLLDPTTGEYLPPPTVCDGRVIQAEPGEGEWVAAYASNTWDHATLCHSATGEQRDILPAELRYWLVDSSPDGAWLTLLGQNVNEGQFQVYAYPLAGEELTPLGTVERVMDPCFSFCGWVSAEKGVLCEIDQYYSYDPVTYRSFDVTQPDSLERLFSGWDNAFYDEANMQFVQLYSENYAARVSGSRNPAHPPCALTVYDADGLHEFELDYECRIFEVIRPGFLPEEQVFRRVDNMLYFFTISSEDAAITELRSYDLNLPPDDRRQTAVLAVGEIEAILSISPDQRYIVLVTDSSGEFDPYPRVGGIYVGWQITIMDRTLQYSDIRYLSEPMTPDQVGWLDERTLAIIARESLATYHTGRLDYDEIAVMQPATMRRITLHDDFSFDMQLITNHGPDLTGYRSLSPDHQYWMYGGNLVDLRTFERAVFLRDDRPDGYSISSEWNDDGTLQVTLRQGDDSVTYRLDLTSLWTSLP